MKWQDFVSKYRKENPHLSYKEALKQCGEIYREAMGTEKKIKKVAGKKGGKKGGKMDPPEWKETDESARIPASWEFEDIPHQPFDTIAGMKKKATGRINNFSTIAPTPAQVKMGGKNMILVNGEHQDIDEGLKTMTAGRKKKEGKGLFGDIGQGVDALTGLLGLGRKIKGGTDNEFDDMVNYEIPLDGGSNELPAFASPNEFEATGKKKGAKESKLLKANLLRDIEIFKKKIESL